VTTPKQAPLDLESPYGTLQVRDIRNHESFKKGERDRTAVLHFKNLTVNRKEYGEQMLYLAHDRTGRFGIEVPDYRTLTDSARRQIEEHFCDAVFPNPILAPYKVPLPEDEWRASYKHSLSLEVYRRLDDTVSRTGALDDESLRAELVDEILRDVLALRIAGKSYWSIRQEASKP
jgi:hypothetical protein